MTAATERATADRIYAEIARVIEHRLSELPEDNDDYQALDECLAGLRCRVPESVLASREDQ